MAKARSDCRAQFQGLFGHHLFEISGFMTQLRDFARVGLPDKFAGQALYRMFNTAIQAVGRPKYLSSVNDLLFKIISDGPI